MKASYYNVRCCDCKHCGLIDVGKDFSKVIGKISLFCHYYGQGLIDYKKWIDCEGYEPRP